MFDIGWSELVLIGVVALIVIGPKELPGVLRAIGQWSAKLRRMAAEFQGQFHEAMREAEMADLKKQVDDINESARSIGRFDPLTYDPDKDKSSSGPGKEQYPSAPAANGAAPAPEHALPAATDPPAATAAPTTPTEAPASPAAPSAPSELGTGNRPA